MIGLGLGWAAPSQAQTTLYDQLEQPALQTDNPEKVTLEMMGYSDKTLRGEVQTARYPLNIPSEWELNRGGEIYLQISTLLNAGTALDSVQSTDSILEVSFNNVLLEQIALLQSGDSQIRLTIPAEAMEPSRDDGRHQLVVRLINGSYCQVGAEAEVLVKAISELTLPHEIGEPTTDLTLLPQPIIQSSFLPNRALLVVPTMPTPEELAAAMTVSAAFGHFSDGELSLLLVHETDLSATLRRDNHLIFVGMANSFTAEGGLSEVDFPVEWRNGLWEAADLAEEDGLVQMAVSPWGSTKVVLLVSGQTEVGISKAAQTIGLGSIRVGTIPNLVIVEKTAVSTVENTELPPLNQTLADAGYGVQTFTGESNDASLLTFFVPENHVTTAEAYINLVFTHSALINYERSGLIVTLNDELIGSARLSETSANLSSTRITIPQTAVRIGQNVLAFSSELEPISDCNRLDDSGVWLTIRPESTLHLPLVPGAAQIQSTTKLSQYPHPFTSGRPFAQTAFILPTSDASAQQVALAMAFQMGQNFTLPITLPRVVDADKAQPDMSEEHDLIIIGQPKSLPFLADLTNSLPVPFLANSNQLNEAYLPTVNRISSSGPTAYLELTASPEGNGRIILAVLGNSDEALILAGSALIMPNIREQLEGNFAIWDDNQLTVETIRTLSADEILVAESIQEGNIPATPVLTGYEPPSWILPTLRGSIILMILIIAYVIIATIRRRA